MENAYIYTRVSTLIQVDGFSLEAQEAEIRAFAEARKINIVGKYTDEGKSGKNAEHRPAFTQMMEDIRSKKDNIRYVLVFKLSRFARNTSDTAPSGAFKLWNWSFGDQGRNRHFNRYRQDDCKYYGSCCGSRA